MKFCIIGLGRFGYQVATGLAENGMEVMAIDSHESIVASISDTVTQAICMRVTDEQSLRSIGVEEMDTVVVAMAENFSQSILITALLKKRLNIKQVIARAINDIHTEILSLVGADQIILPEKEIGIRLADSLSSPFMEQLRLSDNFSLSQINAPKKFIDKKIGDIPFFTTYHVICVGIKREDQLITADPELIIHEQDKILISGKNDALEKVARL